MASPGELRSASRSVTSVAGHMLPLAATGALLMLAYPHPGWGWLAHVALVPAAVVAVRAAGARRLAWCAAVVFGAWWIIMLRWLVPVTVVGWVALALFMAMFWVAALLGLRWLDRRYRSAMVLALPLVWVSAEIVRSHFPEGGFGWFMLGHTQGSYAPGHGAGRLVQIADIFGIYGVSFLVAMTNGLLVDLLTRPLMRRGEAGNTRLRRTIAVGAATWAVAIVGAWGYGQYRISEFAQVTRAGPRVAVVQTNVPQDNKENPTPEQRVQMWRDLVALTRSAAEAQPELIVWPETMVPGALNEEGRAYSSAYLGASYHDQIQSLARELDAALLVGSHVYEDFQRVTVAPGREAVLPTGNYNSVFLYHADGEQADEAYSKMHLVPFGEKIPWVDMVPGLKDLFIRYLTPYEFDYSVDAGERLVLMETGYGAETQASSEAQGEAGESLRFATPICFEDTVSRMCRAMVYGAEGRKRADALMNLTNDGWFAGSAMRAQHVQIASFRSIENRVPTARSVNTGISGFIDSLGRVGPVVVGDDRWDNVTGTAAAELRLDDRATVFGRIGEIPAAVVVLVTLGLILGGWWRRDKIGATR